MMKTGPDGIRLMHYFESCRLQSYPDPATGGEPITIGWGNTAPWVKLGMTITQEEADQLFEERLSREFEPGVMKAVWREPTQHQFDALVSFAYNVGLGNFRSSTLLRKFNAGDDEGAAAQFGVWSKASGKVMKGLQRRREAECRVFLGSAADAAIKYALVKFP